MKYAIPDLKDSRSQVEVDFSTPYNSPEQEKKWRSWGKDIDWGKMKFQGGSEIYTRAQEGGIGGVGGGKSSVRTKDIETAEDRIINENVAHESGYKITNGVKWKDKGRESAKEKNILDAVPSSFPHNDKDKDRDEEITRSSGKRGNIVRTDAQQKKSIRADMQLHLEVIMKFVMPPPQKQQYLWILSKGRVRKERGVCLKRQLQL